MVVYAAQGDARRTMALLWRGNGGGEVRTAPGPKPGLSVDQIVAAAIEVADEVGMAALSMRLVGQKLGRTAMALYTYVPSKRELIDLMYDEAMAELPGRYDVSGGWRAALEVWAADTLSFYVRHPWTLQVSQARPVLGPHEFTALETLLGVLRETGLSPRVVRGAVTTLFDVVRGAARTVSETRQAPAATGLTDEDWWNARSRELYELEPGFNERFPNAFWLDSGQEHIPHDPSLPYLEREARESLRDGLAVVLDGIAAAAARAG